MLKIFAGSDHGGFVLKQCLISHLINLGHAVTDLGTFQNESCDYPDFAHAVAKKVISEPGSFGLLTCGSGVGMSIAANRHVGIRAVLCHNSLEARLSRQHNDANVIALGGRLIGEEMAIDIIETFLTTSFSGGRHTNRIQKIEPEHCEKP